ncbi:MAG TPA: outer membrane protein assembly factor BamA [Terriglobales bacterium]|nr:outer membrane protein assembly factor BamA [Terriglobales bacterium]
MWDWCWWPKLRQGDGFSAWIAFLSCLCLVVLTAIPTLAQQNLVEAIVIHGNRRIPADTIRAHIFTRAGDVYDQAALERDFNSLWNTGYFDDLRIEREPGKKGWILHFYVTEKPTIRELNYVGLNSVSQSDVLDRFKERKVGLSVESQFDPTKVTKAAVVIKEMLAEHGRQFATVRTEVRPLPPAAVSVTFVVKEGPKVKVGNIRFENNHKLKSRELRYAMKNLRPIGIPHSIFLENIFSKTYDASKLNEDAERVRQAYQQKGYFKAIVEDPQTKLRDTHSHLHIPLIQKGQGKVVDITMPVVEGDRYRLGKIAFKNNKAVRNVAALRSLFPMKDGDIFNTDNVRKGLDNLRKAYGELGYINFTSVPDTQINEDKKLITLMIDVDEGKPFFVRRIEFQGNTTTRDKVIRRELAIEEGQVYNTRLWELSLLRLNQLDYFEALKPEEATERKLDEQAGTVDLTLKVREKGKNSIQLTGGVSGLEGSFIGLSYTTNNFLGLGETLQLQASVGNLMRSLMFGFTQPYMFDRPLQMGFTVFNNRINYDQAKQEELLTGQKLNLPQSFLANLQNFTQNDTGFTVSASYPLRRSFKRVGITYAWDTSTIQTFSDASTALFENLAFRGFSGPNALNGIVTSKILPNFSINTIDNPTRPHGGHSVYLAAAISGLGGTVNSIQPIINYKQFIPVNHKRNVIGLNFQGAFLSGFNGLVAPPFQRFYMGGEQDLRGFDIRSISPVTFLPTTVNIPLVNPDGSPVPRNPANPRYGNITVPVPVNQIVFPGGDTSLVSNVEYRIPIVGPVVLAPFADLGFDGIARSSQLKLAPQELALLNGSVFGCPTLNAAFLCTGGQTFKFSQELKVLGGTNFIPRLSTGLELQVMMPIINAPFRIYWAYNALRLDEFAGTPNPISRSMFPKGGAGDFTYQQAVSGVNFLGFSPGYLLREPRKTFRFTVATTF